MAITLIKQNQNQKAKLIVVHMKSLKERIQSFEGQLMKLEELVQTVEFQSIQAMVLKEMQMGTKVLNQIHSDLNLEKVQQITMESREAIQYQKELNQVLASLPEQEQKEVEDELQLLIQDNVSEILKLKVPNNKLPEVNNLILE